MICRFKINYIEREHLQKNMAGSFVEISIPRSREICKVLNIQRKGFNQSISNDKTFEARAGGYHFNEKSKLTLNRRISW